MPTGGTQLVKSSSIEVDGFPQENDHGFDGELVSCLTSQGYPRVLDTDAYGVAPEGCGTPSAVISGGDFVAVLTDDSTTGEEPTTTNLTQIDEYNAANGSIVTGDMPPPGLWGHH